MLHTFGSSFCFLAVFFLCGCSSKEPPGNRVAAKSPETGKSSKKDQTPGVHDVRDLTRESQGLSSVTISADGQRVAAGGINGEITLWNLDKRDDKTVLRGHKLPVTSVSFSPDRRLLLSASNSTVRLWSLESNKQLRTIGKHTAPIRAVFMPDGKRVLVTSGDPSPVDKSVPADPIQVNLFDVETGKSLKEFGRHPLPVKDISLSKDGRLLATATGWAYLWDVESGTLKATFKYPVVIESVALSPDGKHLLTGNYRGIVTLRNLETGTAEDFPEIHTKKATGQHFEQVTSVAFSNDGKWGAASGWSQRVCIFPISDDSSLFHYWDFESWVTGVAFNPVSEHVYASLWMHDSGRVVEIIRPSRKGKKR